MTVQAKIRDMLLHLLPILDVSSVEYWVDFGTLLGIIREKDIIAWDTDGDISYIYSKNQRKNILFCLEWGCARYGYYVREIYLGRFRVYYSEENITQEPWIDFYGWIDKGGERFTSTESGFLKHLWPYKRHIGKVQSYSWMDIQVRTPQYVDARLKQLYGNWKTPKNKAPYWG